MIEKLQFACNRDEHGVETDITPPHLLIVAEKLNEVIEAVNALALLKPVISTPLTANSTVQLPYDPNTRIVEYRDGRWQFVPREVIPPTE